MNTKTAAYVVFGQDKEGKPRAATIPPSDLEVATKAAGSMGLKIGRADTPEALALAKPLPQVRIFATGKGLVPLVKKELYERLSKAVATVEPRPTTDQANPPAKVDIGPQADPKTASKNNPGKNPPAPLASQVSPWAAIIKGSVVLCLDPEPGPDRSYWPAVVTEVSNDGRILTMRWKDFPTPKPFTAKRVAVGLIAKIH